MPDKLKDKVQSSLITRDPPKQKRDILSESIGRVNR